MTEWNDEFECLMRDLMVIGFPRYGHLGSKAIPEKKRLNSIKKRLDSYIKTGNKMYLADIANIAMTIFTECNHPLKNMNNIDEVSRKSTALIV